MNWKRVKFINAFDDITGGNQKFKTNEYLQAGNTPVIDQGKELIAGYIDNESIAFNDIPVIIFGDHTRILKYVDFPFVLGADGVKILKAKSGINPKFAFYILQKVHIPNTGYNRHFKWLKESEIPLPDLATQKHIAAVLDKADALRQHNRQLLAHYDELLQSTFIELFGDPVKNPKGWEVINLKKVSSKFADGPFGSNLKTEHYQESGVRVIRLGNIGVGEFIDKDKAFISHEHHQKVLKKNTCYPGDVIIGTMGEPNLRACILPKYVEVAVNKADCILFRPNTDIVDSIFILSLLNLPNTLKLASKMMHGQTRVRISMGHLQHLEIPLPPLPLQQHFAKIVEQIEAQKEAVRQSLAESEALFKGLLAGYFGAS